MRKDRFIWIVLALIAAAAVFLVARDLTSSSAVTPNDDLGQLLYLSILGLVIGAAVLGSGARLGHTARGLGIWALIALALVAAYQYRYELQDVANRVTAGLVPASPITITDGDGGTVVMLQKRPNGHFEADTQVNGRTVLMIVDTGATVTVLTLRDAERAGIDTSDLTFQVPVSTANGQAMAARVVLDEIAVGAISRSNVPALIASETMLDQSLLGMNFLGTLSGYDIRGDRLLMRD